jgi:hypothetical protein
MGYVITIDNPGLPKGAGVQIAGLGTFENGSEYVVSDEEHDNFRRYHGKVEPVRNKEGEIVGSELQLGPTLLQSNIYGVEVKTEEKSKKKEGDES